MQKLIVLASVLVVLQSTAWADRHHEHEHDHSNAAHDHNPVDRARSLQQAHRFSEAATILGDYLRSASMDGEAQLLHADVLRHAGRLDESRRACGRVALAGATTLAGYCAAQILIDTQDYARADEVCADLAPQRSYLEEGARIWALEISAEAAWRAGKWQKARHLFQQALEFDNVPHSTVDAYAAFLNDTKLRPIPKSLDDHSQEIWRL